MRMLFSSRTERIFTFRFPSKKYTSSDRSMAVMNRFISNFKRDGNKILNSSKSMRCFVIVDELLVECSL